MSAYEAKIEAQMFGGTKVEPETDMVQVRAYWTEDQDHLDERPGYVELELAAQKKVAEYLGVDLWDSARTFTTKRHRESSGARRDEAGVMQHWLVVVYIFTKETA